MADPPIAQRALAGLSLKDMALLWNRDVVVIGDTTVLYRPSFRSAAERDSLALSRWVESLTTAERKRLGEVPGIKADAMPREMIALLARRAESPELAADLVSGVADVTAEPSIEITTTTAAGETLTRTVATRRSVPQTDGISSTIADSDSKAKAIKETSKEVDRWPTALATMRGVGPLDFGDGELLPLTTILERAKKTFNRTYVCDERAAETKLFVRGRWTSETLIKALSYTVPVPAPEPIATFIVGEKGDPFALENPSAGEYTPQALSKLVPRLEDWFSENRVPANARVTARPIVDLVIYAAPRRIGTNGRIFRPFVMQIK